MATVGTLANQFQRWSLISRTKADARFRGSTVAIDIDPSCRFRGTIKVRVVPQTSTTVRIGPRCLFGSDVMLVLGGGSLNLGSSVVIRDGAILHVRGDLSFGHRAILSYYSVVHCDESVVIGERTGIGEHCTISDSAHAPAPPGEWWYSYLETSPVRLEEEIWIGAKVTVTPGVKVGAGSILAAGAVITGDVEPDSIMAGIPARRVGDSPLRSQQ